MKPGYYLSESNNLQLWYPKNHFLEGFQAMEIMLEDDKWVRVRYTKEDVEMVNQVLEFEYLGDL